MTASTTAPVEPQPRSRPTPEEIEAIALRHQTAKAAVAVQREAFELIEQEAVRMVREFGIVVPHAEKSRRLAGGRAVLTVTHSDMLTISDERVETLKEALEANGFPDFFKRLFTLRSKYEVVEGAEAALKTEALPKRLSEKVLNLWGRCISVKPKKPALKVAILDPATPAKRAKKGGVQ